MPFIGQNFFKFLTSHINSYEIILPTVDGFIHKLCGIYSRSCLVPTTELLNGIDHSLPKDKKHNITIDSLINRCKTKYVPVESENFYFKDLFFNMNTQDDYEYLVSMINSINQK